MTHANLYVVTATVIPVLLLTSSLQATFYRRYMEHLSEPLLQGRHRRKPRYGRWVAKVMAVLTLLLAASGEIEAIRALATNHDTPAYRTTVTASLLGLFLLVTIAVGREILADLSQEPDQR